MNTIATLKKIRDELCDSNLDPMNDMNHRALSSLSLRIQQHAEELKALDAVRLMDLEENGPKIFVGHDEYTVILLRDGEEVVINFVQQRITFESCHTEEERNKWRLTHPPSEDGSTYFIKAEPTGWIYSPFAIWITKEEYVILKQKLDEIMLAEWRHYQAKWESTNPKSATTTASRCVKAELN